MLQKISLMLGPKRNTSSLSAIVKQKQFTLRTYSLGKVLAEKKPIKKVKDEHL